MGVQINGDTGNVIATKGTFSGDVGIGGTLTYEDVTNVDSVGLITARAGVVVGSGITLSKDGDIFATGITTITANNVIGLNVENNSGSGAQTTIRSKSTEANASNFVRSESSDNKYIGLLKYGTGHSAYGALAAGGGAVYANSSVPITIMSDGSYINFATGGNTERLRIAADGKVGVNETPTISQLEVKSAQLGGTSGNTQEVLRLHSPDVSNTTSYRFTNYRTSNGTAHTTSELRFRRHVDSTDMGYLGLGDGYVSIGYGTAEKLRVNSSGNLLLGTTTSSENLRLAQKFAIVGHSDVQYPGMNITNYNSANNGSAGLIDFQRSRSSSDGGHTIVQASDKLGEIIFRGADGNGFSDSSAIRALVDTTPGDGDMPGRLTFSTSADGSASLVERMRIDNKGYITMPSQCSVAVRMSAGSTSWPGDHSFANDNGRLSFDTELWDIGGNFNTSNYTFTAPVAGRYLMVYHIQFENFTGFNWVYMYPVVNDSVSDTQARGISFSDFGPGSNSASGTYYTISHSVIANLQANDAVKFKVRGSANGTIKGGSESQWNINLLN